MPLPPMIIEAPPLTAPRRSGLFVAANGPMPLEQHAETTGAQWWSNACGGSKLYPPACSDAPYTAFDEGAASGLEDAFPVVVYSSIKCPPVGKSLERAREDARARLEASEEAAVESAFWGGQTTPVAIPGILERLSLQGGSNMVLIAGTAANVKEATSKLEQQSAASTYYGPTILHFRPAAAAYMGGAGLLKSRVSTDGEHQFTHYGSEVVFGQGYSGSSPDNVTAPDSTTEYGAVTGRVFIWRSEVFFQDQGASAEPGLNKTTNQRTVIAWRVYAVGVECFAAMIKFTRA